MRIHQDLRSRQWNDLAARRPDFSGVEGGANESLTSTLFRRLLRGRADADAGRLLCVLAGGSWPQERRFKAGFTESSIE